MERPRSKTLLYFGPGSRVVIVKSLDLRQALAALRTTGRENLASTLGRLTRAVTDFPFPLDLRRLPCHLHDYLFLSTEIEIIVYHNAERSSSGFRKRLKSSADIQAGVRIRGLHHRLERLDLRFDGKRRTRSQDTARQNGSLHIPNAFLWQVS